MHLRNVAIIAHVDHGKTTLVDQLLKQSGQFRAGELEKLAGGQHDLIMDSNPLERERGITILSKNCAVRYTAQDGVNYRINVIDTPGHADFGGEVERVLRMADGCLLVVDAFEGPMPQTRFVLGKALELGLRPVVVVNKCDRPDQRAHDVISEVFDLLVELGANDAALDFPIVYASARNGWAVDHLEESPGDGTVRPVFEAIVRHVPEPTDNPDAPLQMLITTLAYSEYVGRIGIGRVFAGSLKAGQRVTLIKRDGRTQPSRANGLQRFDGLGRVEADLIEAGDLCALTGLEGVDIGDTVADPERPMALPPVTVDEPTITMMFRINDSPFAGQEGQFVTSRQLRERLMRELEHNVALRVHDGRTSDEFVVAGRGLLHLGILLENMRREGYELSVGKPHVILKDVGSRVCEPLERLVIDVPTHHVGPVMELVGGRRGELVTMDTRGESMSHLVFEITSRALIGLRTRVLTATQGEGVMHHNFDRYVPMQDEPATRIAGVQVATETGQVTAYAVQNLADRGVMFVSPGDRVYMGQVVGEHNKGTDIPVNVVKEKKLDNMRSANKEATVTLKAPRRVELEAALEYIEDDELVEITPTSVRIRKKLLDESARKRSERMARGV